ncbi:MAG: ATP-binding protein [bacterium]|nr:ATP-binding protein [bacterium]
MSNISNGTLRALALLVAVLQPASNHGGTGSLIGIEEPEKAIHPAAVAALGDAFLDASQATQVMVSTHSPDFLDNEAHPGRCDLSRGAR